MEQLVKKYAEKLVLSGLGDLKDPFQPIFGGIDDTIVWNRETDEIQVLEKIFQGLNINSLGFLSPVEPYSSILTFLGNTALNSDHLIIPQDCETKTFFHDIPVIDRLDSQKITAALKKRKSVIIIPGINDTVLKHPAIIAHGSISPEQAFVSISSICFSCFVKFFSDFLFDLQLKQISKSRIDLFESVKKNLIPFQDDLPLMKSHPFKNREQVYEAVIEAGRVTVEYGLVDSYFGNVSCFWQDTLFISQTGSSLDELAGHIDPVPLDGSSSASITASSELSAHIKVIEQTRCRAVLHGHPKFSVILSMDCSPENKFKCRFKDQCHIKCPEKRFAGPTPIVPGEVGTGRYGLCNTLPRALEHSDSAIVYGHGLFTTGRHDFNKAFETMLNVEKFCFDCYFDKIKTLSKNI